MALRSRAKVGVMAAMSTKSRQVIYGGRKGPAGGKSSAGAAARVEKVEAA
jgi:hypothetical protein